MYNHFCMHVCLSVCYILCKLYNIVIWCNMYIFASLCLPINRLGQPFVGTYNHQNFCKGLAIVSPGNMLRCSHNLSRLFRIHVFQIKKATKTLPAASRLVDGTKRPFLHAKTDIDSGSFAYFQVRYWDNVLEVSRGTCPKSQKKGFLRTPLNARCHQLGVFFPPISVIPTKPRWTDEGLKDFWKVQYFQTRHLSCELKPPGARLNDSFLAVMGDIHLSFYKQT